MWFKNLQLFQLTEEFPWSAESLAERLQDFAFEKCAAMQAKSQGWICPSQQEDGSLMHSANGFILLCLKTEEKLIPAGVLNDMLADKVQDIETRQGRKIRKKEKQQIKEELYQSLLPRAFSRHAQVYAYIDLQDNWLVVNTSSLNKAESFCDYLRRSLGSLKIKLPEVEPISMMMTAWLQRNDYPEDLTIEDTCVLEDSAEGGTIRCKKQNLLAEDIQALIGEGRTVAQLTLSWREQMLFTLKQDFSIGGIKYLEIIQDQARDIYTETDQARFDADFTIMTETLRHFLRSLIQSVGKDSNAPPQPRATITSTNQRTELATDSTTQTGTSFDETDPEKQAEL